MHVIILIKFSCCSSLDVFMLYVAVSEWLHILSTRCDHCHTCHQAFLWACQL